MPTKKKAAADKPAGKKAKKTAETSVTTTETAAKPEPAAPASSFQWQESLTRETVPEPMNLEDRSLKLTEIGDLLTEIETAESSKKASAAGWKSTLDTLDEKLKLLRNEVDTGSVLREVDCKWDFECGGDVPGTDERIYNPQVKALRRTDTGKVIRTAPISESDRQGVLAFELSDEAAEKALGELGWVLMSDEDPAEGREPFYIEPLMPKGKIAPEDSEHDIVGASDRQTALRGALQMLKEHPEIKPNTGAAPEPEKSAEWQAGYAARAADQARTSPHTADSPEDEQWNTGYDAKSGELSEASRAAA